MLSIRKSAGLLALLLVIALGYQNCSKNSSSSGSILSGSSATTPSTTASPSPSPSPTALSFLPAPEGSNYTGLYSNQINGIAVSGSTLYLATTVGLSISTDGGKTFATRTLTDGLGSLNTYGVAASGSLVVVTTAGGVSVSSDGGTTFKNNANIIPYPAQGFASQGVAISGTDVYVVGTGGLQVSTDSGNTFTAANIGGASVTGIAVAVSGTTVFLSTFNGTTLKGALMVSQNSGTTFTAVSIPTTTQIYSLAISGNNVYATDDFSLYVSTNSGQTFTAAPSTGSSGLTSIGLVYASGSNVYISSNVDVTTNTIGNLYVSSNGGNTFTVIGTPATFGTTTGYSINSVWVTATDLYVGLGAGAGGPPAAIGGLAISANSGQSYTLLGAPLNDGLITALASSGSTVVVGTDGSAASEGDATGVYISTDGGNTFVHRTSANGLDDSSINDVFATPTTIYVASQENLFKSTNGGSTFTQLTLNWAGFASALYASGNNIYAGTGNGDGLWMSTNGGTTFTQIPGSTLGSNGVIWGTYANGNSVYVYSLNFSVGTTVSVGEFSVSNDGGTTFTNTTMPVRTPVSMGGLQTANALYGVGSTIYLSTSTGLMISTDGGQTFVTKTMADGLPSNAVISSYSNGSMLVVATGGGLSVSYDGGQTFLNSTTANGLWTNDTYLTTIVGSTVLAGTPFGLFISQ